MTITVDSLEVAIPGQNPNRDEIWTDFASKYTLIVEGQPISVPEPSPTSILTLMGLGLLLAKKKLV